MKIDSRIISGSDLFRPQPTVFQSEDGNTIGVITNWGGAAATQIVTEKIKSALAPKFFDPDETQVKRTSNKKKEYPIEWKLAEALRLANEELFRVENEKLWKTVIEATVIHVDRSVLYWAQAGVPHLLISSNTATGSEAQFLSVSVDPSFVFNQPSPLPMSGLGLDLFPNVNSGSVVVRPGLKIALLSVAGRALPLLSQTPFSVNDFADAISFSFPQQPAWVAVTEVY